MEAEVPLDALGRRVSCSGERATVRYVGPVPPTAGLWLGVEWDNPDRGKHAGSHEGVQYFRCRSPRGGSFIRPAKASFGVDYLTALQQMYHSDMEEVRSQEISVSSKKLEWASGTKDLRFENLQSVILVNCEVNGPGPEGQAKNTTPYVRCLSLCESLLRCWEDVAALAQQMEELEELLLSSNRLSVPSHPSTHSQAFLRLKLLVLNKCELTWPQILECAPMWPELERLYLEENNISELQRPEGVLQSLKSLNLFMNPLEETSILSLAALPRLEKLILSHTGLSRITFEDADPGSQTAMFPALTNLNLDHNNISEWCVVDELAKLPRLVVLSCRGNGLVSEDNNPQTAKQMIIAKLGGLNVLNGSQILPQERRGAELDYIKLFGEEWLKAGGLGQSGSQFTEQHPRYQTLITMYGAPEEGELKKPQPFALKNQLLNITFIFPDHSDRKPLEKKLPTSMVVQKVKGLLYRLLKVPVADLRLTYTTPKKVGTEFEIDSDLKTLQFYSIEDGDQVLVRWS